MEVILKLIALFGLGFVLSDIDGKYRNEGGFFPARTFRAMLRGGNTRIRFYGQWIGILIGVIVFGISCDLFKYALVFFIGAGINILRFIIVDISGKNDGQ